MIGQQRALVVVRGRVPSDLGLMLEEPVLDNDPSGPLPRGCGDGRGSRR